MALQIEWTPDAELHLTEILEYWIARNGSDFFSKQLYQAVKKILEVLSRYPESGRITSNFSSCSASRCFTLHFGRSKTKQKTASK